MRLGRVYDHASLVEIKQATGIGWSDADILRANGVVVNEVANRGALYQLTAANRVQMYCRGANEVVAEENDWDKVSNPLTLGIYDFTPYIIGLALHD